MPGTAKCALFLAAGLLIGPSPAFAVTQDSPEVKQVVDRALAYLEKSADDGRLGARCLVGLCMLKNGRDESHPKIRAALAACEDLAKNPQQAAGGGLIDNYSIGLGVIFLCDLDPVKHKATAERIVDVMLNRQQKGGGWGYAGNTTGDTSQTQYGALGMWMAQSHGIKVPQPSVEALCGWLLRTQDPSGAWGYQGNDPGVMTRVAQNEVRHSLAAAGLGSVYICADLLGITDPKEEQHPENALPSALRVVESKQAKKKREDGISKLIDAGAVRRSMADGNRWFAQNYSVKSQSWTFYYLYGLERYQSFRERAEGETEREPRWYNDVFAFLERTQLPAGNWHDENADDGVNTSFAVLCLSRSSRKSIEKVKAKALGEGVLLGGIGLPPNTADLQERNGKVVQTPLGGSVEEILAIIEDPNNPELARLAEMGESISLDSDVTKRSGQINRLRALVSAGSYQSRLVAVKTLCKVRDLDNVPVLLFALTDPDVRIVREADKGLRFISRKFAGIGLPDEPKPVDIQAAQKAWKEWYLAVRPDAELLE